MSIQGDKLMTLADGQVLYNDARNKAKTGLDGKADGIEKSIATPANVMTFEDGSDGMPMAVKVGIEPVQDLHGYDYPWPGGGGKNRLPVTLSSLQEMNTDGTWNGNVFTKNSITFEVETDNGGNVISIVVNGTYSANTSMIVGQMKYQGYLDMIQNTSSTLLSTPSGGSDGTYYTVVYGNKNGSRTNVRDTGNGRTLTASTFDDSNSDQDLTIRLQLIANYEATNMIFKPMIITAEEEQVSTEYAPYTNICPIAGWTGCNIYNEAEYNASATPKLSVTFPASAGTVYGGNLTVNKDGTGTLVADWGCVQVKDLTWTYDNSQSLKRFQTSISGIKQVGTIRKLPMLSSAFIPISDGRAFSAVPVYGIYSTGGSENVYVHCNDYTTPTEFVTEFGEETIVYPLATPVTYTFTATQIASLLGTNNLYADTGDILQADYTADTRKYVDNVIPELDVPIVSDSDLLLYSHYGHVHTLMSTGDVNEQTFAITYPTIQALHDRIPLLPGGSNMNYTSVTVIDTSNNKKYPGYIYGQSVQYFDGSTYQNASSTFQVLINATWIY